jgi:hypothetical protein
MLAKKSVRCLRDALARRHNALLVAVTVWLIMGFMRAGVAPEALIVLGRRRLARR